MNATVQSVPKESVLCEVAKQRLLAVKGDPFLFADWGRVVFIHFAIEPAKLYPYAPPPFELELYDGRACISLVAVTMRRFRPCRPASLSTWLFRPIASQTFLNVRTYVRCGDERGALFLWGWLSRPLCVPIPSGLFGLPYGFATLRFEHQLETGELRGVVTSRAMPGRFAYRVPITPDTAFVPCAAGTLEEFALERYTGFFSRGNDHRAFRVGHPPWLQMPIQATLEDRDLLDAKFPWFKDAQLIGAHYAPGFDHVWLGKAHRLRSPCVDKEPLRKQIALGRDQAAARTPLSVQDRTA